MPTASAPTAPPPISVTPRSAAATPPLPGATAKARIGAVAKMKPPAKAKTATAPVMVIGLSKPLQRMTGKTIQFAAQRASPRRSMGSTPKRSLQRLAARLARK